MGSVLQFCNNTPHLGVRNSLSFGMQRAVLLTLTPPISHATFLHFYLTCYLFEVKEAYYILLL